MSLRCIIFSAFQLWMVTASTTAVSSACCADMEVSCSMSAMLSQGLTADAVHFIFPWATEANPSVNQAL
jgi:hypothetical protein